MINNQNKSKFFLVIIAILFIANIAMLAFFLQKKETGNRGGSRTNRKGVMTNFLKNEIGFNQAQLSKYDSLSSLRYERFNILFETMRKNKNENYKKLVEGNFTDSVINLAADQSAATQKMMEVTMSNHIKNVRNLCTPEQLPKFDTLFVKVFNKRSEGRKKEKK